MQAHCEDARRLIKKELVTRNAETILSDIKANMAIIENAFPIMQETIADEEPASYANKFKATVASGVVMLTGMWLTSTLKSSEK